MCVLLVSMNTERLPDPVFPLGLACLAGALTQAGREYRVHDLLVQDAAGLAQAAAAKDISAVAMSIRNLDNVSYPQSVSYLADYRRIAAELPRGAVPLILGGSGFSLYPELLLRELDADYGVIGSGEGPLPALLDALETGQGLSDVPNLLIRTDGGITRAPQNGRTVQAAQALPFCRPRREGFAPGAYRDMGGMANIQTKRGCPFRCVYCSYPLIEGTVPILRPLDDVLSEIEELVGAGFREIYFTDSVFNHPPEYAKQLCAGIVDAGLDIVWTCYASPLGFDREMAALFKLSGCMGVEFGSDSLSEVMLGSLGKPFTAGQARRASLLCAEAGLPFCHAILLGGPGESERTMKETVSALSKFPSTSVIFMTGIRIIPGTRLHAIAKREGVVREDDPLLEPAFYLSEGVRPLFPSLAKRLSRSHRNWVFPGHSIRFSLPLAETLRRRGARGPLWLNFAQ